MAKNYKTVAAIFDKETTADKFYAQVESNYPSEEDVYDIQHLVIKKNCRTFKVSVKDGANVVVFKAKEELNAEIQNRVISLGGSNILPEQLATFGIPE